MRTEIVKMDYCPKCKKNTGSVANTGHICRECGGRYRPPKVDLSVGYREVTKPVCEMCGMKKPATVIMNPNVFPGNDDSKPEHFWDVCNGCKDFVNASMAQSYGGLVDDFMRRWERTNKENEK